MSSNAPSIWYSYLMLNELDYRYEPSAQASSQTGAWLTSNAPTPDGSIPLVGGQLAPQSAADDGFPGIQNDLTKLRAYCNGLSVRTTEEPDKGWLYYDSSKGGIEPGDFGDWGFFVSGATTHNQEQKDLGKKSLFCVTSPLPVVYDGENAPDPGDIYTGFYIPEFNMQGSNLFEFLSSTEPLPYELFPQNTAYDSVADPSNATIRPDNWNGNDVPNNEGYYLSTFFTQDATNGLPYQNLGLKSVNLNASLTQDSKWKTSVLLEITNLQNILLAYGASGGTSTLSTVYSISQQYNTNPSIDTIPGYYLLPPVSSRAVDGTNIYYQNNQLSIINKNPYLNLLYLKIKFSQNEPAWWSQTGAPTGIPLYQSATNAPISFSRSNLISQSDTPLLIPNGGGVFCFSEAFQDNGSTCRLLMLFGNSQANAQFNVPDNIVPGASQANRQAWPVSIGQFNLNLEELISTWAAETTTGVLTVELNDNGNESYSYGLNYLDINGAYLQTSLVGKSVLADGPPQFVPGDGKSIDPCGQFRTYYDTQPFYGIVGTTAAIVWQQGFDCGQSYPEYAESGGPQGYGYFGLTKQTQDLGSINFINSTP